MVFTTSNSSVTLSTSTGRVSGSVDVYADGSKVASVSGDGSTVVPNDGTTKRVGSSGSYALSVAWPRTGSVTGSVAGPYQGSTGTASCLVTVGQSGKRRPKRPAPKKPAKRRVTKKPAKRRVTKKPARWKAARKPARRSAKARRPNRKSRGR